MEVELIKAHDSFDGSARRKIESVESGGLLPSKYGR